VIKNDIAAGDLVRVVANEGGDLLKEVKVFDVFKGKQIGEGLKSIALNLTFSSMEKTLTESEIDKRIEKILQKLKSDFSAELRS
jgi:phenylalanyl-tRNA synthetase beta chain